jgi:glycolate oxidase iron-sulfur subunit
MRKNIDAFSTLDVEYIVTDCSSCSSFLKKYPEILRVDDKYYQRSIEFSSRVKDIVELMAGTSSVPKSPAFNRKVTFHDPCHLSRSQNITSEPRNLLSQVPGLRYVELPEANWCCGGAGTYNILHRDISMKILHRKMENLKLTEADVLVTSCPACLAQLSYGVRLERLPVEVKHITQII